MSGHERERLSAYLDDELSPGERASVEAHLASCAECVDWLGRLAAVDSRLAARTLDTPEGYFDAFPHRVRLRIGASAGVRSGRSSRGLPVWTWGLAAALLLAVLTPAVLREPAVAPSRTPQGYASSNSPPQPRPLKDSAERDASGSGASAMTAAAPRELDAEIRAQVSQERALDRRSRASAQRSVGPSATTDSLTRAPAAPPPSRERSRRAVAPETEQQDGRSVPRAYKREGFASTPPLATAAPEEDRAAGSAETLASTGTSLAAQAEGERGALGAAAPRVEAPPLAGPGVWARSAAAGEDAAVEGEFRRLDAERPAGTDGWRRLREAWRAFALAHPAHRRADEARVRTVAAGIEARRRGGAAVDEEIFRRDAEAYLARADGAQKERVERLMEASTPRVR